ncbi:MAG: hypothetical protein HC796_09345 [Synechococcaceae cyanobacterium RL_1_2]|nr:hypothetical protein [Synechococcaceae cyanobacterium RL_1_2]
MKKQFYLDKNHNNPSTDPIRENYINLRARDLGLTIDDDGHIKRAKEWRSH